MLGSLWSRWLSKFNWKSDGPKNSVKMTATDIGEFIFTDWACSISDLYLIIINTLGGNYVPPPSLFSGIWHFFVGFQFNESFN